MHLPQIFHPHTLQISLRGGHAGVAQDFGEVEKIPPSTEIPNGEGVPQRMGTAPDTLDLEAVTE